MSEQGQLQQHGEVVDAHAHFLPRAAIARMGIGRAVVEVGAVCGVDDNITLNGMAVGSTVERLASVDTILASMEATGITTKVLSPPPFTYRYWSDPSDGIALCRLLNDALAEVVAAHPGAFRGLCTVPLQDPALALAEFERANDLGLVGVTLGTNVDGGNLSDPALRRLLGAIAERGAATLVHPDFVPNERLGQHYLINLIGMPTETAIALGNLVVSGALEQLADLRICFVHGGGSLPYLLGRLTKGWEVRPETRSATSAPPVASLGNVFFDSLTHSPQALRYLVDVVGSDHVLIGTDSPFDVEDPEPLAHLDRCPHLTGGERTAVLRSTAMRWLGEAESGR